MSMSPDELNKQYWSQVDPDKILSGVHFPGVELLGRLQSGSKVLDVGCGDGKVAEFLYKKGCVVTGIDINEAALAQNRDNNPAITYLYSDITATIPAVSDSFDAIVIPYVFVSIIDRAEAKRAASELVRVLKPGGILWLCEATYSPDYISRYIVGKEITGLENVAASFSRDASGNQTTNLKRLIRHYSATELDILFGTLTNIWKNTVSEKSPHSGLSVETIVSVYQK